MKAILTLLLLIPCVVAAELKVGEVPPPVTLEKASGGMLDGTTWSSGSMTGRVTVLFYVDPDQSDLNGLLAEALRKKQYPLYRYQSVAIINMAASSVPNFVLSRILKSKQARYPRALYVRDYKKVLVSAWGLADDTYDVLLFSPDGRLQFSKPGKLTKKESDEFVERVGQMIADMPVPP